MPRILNPDSVTKCLKELKESQKLLYDRNKKALALLQTGQLVYEKHHSNDSWREAEVVDIQDERSYIISKNDKLYRRNRVHIRPQADDDRVSNVNDGLYRTRVGRPIKPPEKLGVLMYKRRMSGIS